MKKLFSLFLAFSLLVTPMAQADFTDLALYSSYNESILWMQDNGILEGYEDGSFGPELCINRAEYLAMLYKMLDLELDEGSADFADVDEGVWYEPYLVTAVNRGSIQGYPDGTFRADQCVARVEAIKIASLEFNNAEIPTVNDPYYSKTYDDISADEWYYDSFDYAASANVLGTDHITGSDSIDYSYLYSPGGSMTRSEVAEMLFRLQSIQDHTSDSYGYDDRPNMFAEELYFYNQCSASYGESSYSPADGIAANSEMVMDFDLGDNNKVSDLQNYLDTWGDFTDSVVELYEMNQAQDLIVSNDIDRLMGENWEMSVALDLDISNLFYGTPDVYVGIKVEDPEYFETYVGNAIYHEFGNDYTCSKPAEFSDTVYWTSNDDDTYIARHKDVFILANSTAERERALSQIMDKDTQFEMPSELLNISNDEVFSIYVKTEGMIEAFYEEAGLAGTESGAEGMEEYYMDLELNGGQAEMYTAIGFENADAPYYKAMTSSQVDFTEYVPEADTLLYMERPSQTMDLLAFTELMYVHEFDTTSLTEEELDALSETGFAFHLAESDYSTYVAGSLYFELNNENETAMAALHDYFVASAAQGAVVEAAGDLTRVSHGTGYGDEEEFYYYGYLADDVYVLSTLIPEFENSLDWPSLSDDSKFKASLDNLGGYDKNIVFADFEELEALLERISLDAPAYDEEGELGYKISFDILGAMDYLVSGSSANNNVLRTSSILKARD
jgi:hypothetical protein